MPLSCGGLNPRPSSCIDNNNRSRSWVTVILTFRASACWTMLCNASWTIRYMQVLWSSVSSSETSSAATFTQIPLLLEASRACHCNAGTSPRSSSMEGRSSRAMFRTTRIDSSRSFLISSAFFERAASSLLRIRFDRFAISSSTPVSACPTSSCSSREIILRSSSCASRRRADNCFSSTRAWLISR